MRSGERGYEIRGTRVRGPGYEGMRSWVRGYDIRGMRSGLRGASRGCDFIRSGVGARVYDIRSGVRGVRSRYEEGIRMVGGWSVGLDFKGWSVGLVTS